jgi:hypothetical protein
MIIGKHITTKKSILDKKGIITTEMTNDMKSDFNNTLSD